MPVNAIKGPESEESWARAKKIAKEQYPGLESKDSERFYATVMTIYKSLCTKHKCSPKNESMKDLLNRLEESYGNDWGKHSYQEWNLNGSDEKVLRDAARDLDLAMKTGLKRLKKLMAGKDASYEGAGKMLEKAWKSDVRPFLKKYESLGAMGGKSVYVAAQGLVDAVKNRFGIKGMTDLGKYIV